MQPADAPSTPESPRTYAAIWRHLKALRQCLIRSALAVTLIFLCLFYFANDLYTWLASPLLRHLPEGSTMIAAQVATPFLAPLKLAFVVSFFIAMPFLLYQLWAFIAPGLYQREKRVAFPLLFVSPVLFYSGMIFSYFIVLPLVFAFFTSSAPEGVQVMTDISHYLNFVLKLLFAFGFAFQVPVVVVLLTQLGVVTAEKLVQMRPYVIVGAFIVGMLLTPPDVISQILLALPIWLLFELSVWWVRRFNVGSLTPERSAAKNGSPE